MNALLRYELIINPDGSWATQCVAQDGTSIPAATVARLLSLSSAAFLVNPGLRIIGESEAKEAAAKAEAYVKAGVIPDGWEPTLDGCAITLMGSAQSFSKTFRRVADGVVHEAPVADQDGTVTPDTAGVLRAFDTANPVQPVTDATASDNLLPGATQG